MGPSISDATFYSIDRKEAEVLHHRILVEAEPIDHQVPHHSPVVELHLDRPPRLLLRAPATLRLAAVEPLCLEEHPAYIVDVRVAVCDPRELRGGVEQKVPVSALSLPADKYRSDQL